MKYTWSLSLRAVTETELLEDFRIVKEGVDGQYHYAYMPPEDRELDLEEHDDAEHEEKKPEPIRVKPTLRTFFFLLAQMVAQLGDDNDKPKNKNDKPKNDDNVLADLSNKIAAINVNELGEKAMTDMISGFLTRGVGDQQ
ncbi:hypothetical protein CRE_24127 [Caenorhabditis remanei]|uniref:Uncharacterized protein n=1 Tax=Caenorhabditis remanei TaxID=31234 RepID=E3N429_CAERE|nr:hypothetical protein CRE_24127 [Caenorhabditis remanei]